MGIVFFLEWLNQLFFVPFYGWSCLCMFTYVYYYIYICIFTHKSLGTVHHCLPHHGTLKLRFQGVNIWVGFHYSLSEIVINMQCAQNLVFLIVLIGSLLVSGAESHGRITEEVHFGRPLQHFRHFFFASTLRELLFLTGSWSKAFLSLKHQALVHMRVNMEWRSKYVCTCK